MIANLLRRYNKSRKEFCHLRLHLRLGNLVVLLREAHVAKKLGINLEVRFAMMNSNPLQGRKAVSLGADNAVAVRLGV